MSNRKQKSILYCEQKGNNVNVIDTSNNYALCLTGEYISNTSDTVTIRSWGYDDCKIFNVNGKVVGHRSIPRPSKNEAKVEHKPESNNSYSNLSRHYHNDDDDVEDDTPVVYHNDPNVIVHQGRAYNANEYEFVYAPEFRDYVLTKKREMTSFGKFYSQCGNDARFWIAWILVMSGLLIIAGIANLLK